MTYNVENRREIYPRASLKAFKLRRRKLRQLVRLHWTLNSLIRQSTWIQTPKVISNRHFSLNNAKIDWRSKISPRRTEPLEIRLPKELLPLKLRIWLSIIAFESERTTCNKLIFDTWNQPLRRRNWSSFRYFTLVSRLSPEILRQFEFLLHLLGKVSSGRL